MLVWDRLFYTLNFGPYLPMYINTPIPQIATYIIGNPIIAQTMFAHDWIAGLHVPVRVLVVESTPASAGCTIIWDVPSSLIAIGALKNSTEEAKLKAAAAVLDHDLEIMLRNVTGIGSA